MRETFLATLQICMFVLIGIRQQSQQATTHIGQTHNADDTTPRRIVSCIPLCTCHCHSSRVLFWLWFLVNVSNRLLKLTISGAIVTTLILFLVAAVATRRRRRWRLHHPFRNIGQQIYSLQLIRLCVCIGIIRLFYGIL